MRYLEEVARWAEKQPEVIAVRNSDGESMSYSWLWEASDSIANYISETSKSGDPVIVYGCKSIYMIPLLLGCLKASHPYVAVDASLMKARVIDIAAQLPSHSLFFATVPAPAVEGVQVVELAEIEKIADEKRAFAPCNWANDDDLAYILFTSGSTGAPKGVMITSECVDNFMDWAVTIGQSDGERKVILNQVPFSFDVSLYDLVVGLSTGGTVYCLSRETSENFSKLYAALEDADPQIVNSTPSFVELCLANKGFNQENFKRIELFVLAGEVLTKTTSRKILDRFPQARLINAYGPTESTDLVTAIEVTREMLDSSNPIPIGKAKPGTYIRIVNPESGAECATGEVGELIIEGNTVALGYYNREKLTGEKFGEGELNGVTVRTYRTGDAAYKDDTGVVHYRGRIDFQVKLNGYRIELGDIEENLRKLDGIEQAVVLPRMKEGKVSYLVAHVVSSNGKEGTFADVQEVRSALKELVPDYMVPKKIIFRDRMPMNTNGKIDRKALEEKN